MQEYTDGGNQLQQAFQNSGDQFKVIGISSGH